jgi:hypothetical protein
MTAKPEGVPNGAPFDWAQRPRIWRGSRALPGWTEIVSTGMVYTARGHPPIPGVRVQLRNLRLFVKPLRTQAWCMLDSAPTPGGALFYENFAGDKAVRADTRTEASGGVSIQLVAGRNFHFWSRHVPIPAGGLAGVYVEYEARLITDRGAKRTSINHAAYLGTASADYWRPNTPSGHVQVNNEDVAIARFKRITPQWRLFTMNSTTGKPTAPSPARDKTG